MRDTDRSTRARICAAAKEEFLAKGFQGSSLRNIVRTAGVTTGAFYGYYASKEELFEALVGEVYGHMMGQYRAALDAFAALPPQVQPDCMGQISGACMQELLLYMDGHREEMHLLLQCADGTRYETLLDELVDLELEATHRYYAVLRSLGRAVPDIDERLEHILVTGLMNAYFEIVIHDMPLSEAQRYLRELGQFYTAGWTKIMGQ